MDDFPPAGRDEIIENRIFDELRIGESASLVRTLTKDDILLFASVSGDINPAHLDDRFAETGMFHKLVAHGMWGGALISAVLGTKLPGPGTIYLGQDLRFLQSIALGDRLTVTVTVKEKRPAQHVVLFDCLCRNQAGATVISGTATVEAPTVKIRQPGIELPEIRLSRHERYRDLLARCKGKPPVPTAIVHPCDALSLGAAVEAAAAGLITPILVGPEAKIRAAAKSAGADIGAFRLVDTPHSHAAAERAVELVRAAEAMMLMKGSLHTDEMMGAVVAKETGLRTERRISHVYLFDVPGYPRPLLVTDAAINIAPTLEDKRDIIQNAIDLAHVLGIALPKVAVLSAVETVTPKLVSTLDAAALCKMADRGQITGGMVDGPLAFDNAVSPQAARDKHIVSPVAGQADILVVPDLEAGNMLAKQLTFLAGADAAGVVLGARVPIILTSRADAERTRMASCAVAAELARGGKR
jgi:phosphotransacetylase/acyl dehydratase